MKNKPLYLFLDENMNKADSFGIGSMDFFTETSDSRLGRAEVRVLPCASTSEEQSAFSNQV